MIKLLLNLVDRQVDTEKRTIKVRGTTESEDRMGDVIEASGWELGNFQKNPVIPWSHRTGDPPIARATMVERVQNGLDFILEFPSRELFPFGDFIFRMMAAGFINATSVGFLPKEREIMLDEDGRFQGIRFKRQELLELSVVTVPANPEALVLDFEQAIEQNVTTIEELKQYEQEFEFTVGKCPEYKQLAEELVKEHKLLQKDRTSDYNDQEEKQMEEKIKELENMVTNLTNELSEVKEQLANLGSFKDMSETSQKLMGTINDAMKNLMGGKTGSNPIKQLLAGHAQGQSGQTQPDMEQVASFLKEMGEKVQSKFKPAK